MRKKRKTQQALRKMKLFALFMFLGFCTCRATVSAQDARIDLEMSNVTLSQVFQRYRTVDRLYVYLQIRGRAVQSSMSTVDATTNYGAGCSGEMSGKYRVVIFV